MWTASVYNMDLLRRPVGYLCVQSVSCCWEQIHVCFPVCIQYVCVWICVSFYTFLSIYLYLCLNAHAFHHASVCFCLYLCIFICSSLCHLFCLIMCVYPCFCVCVCVWSGPLYVATVMWWFIFTSMTQLLAAVSLIMRTPVCVNVSVRERRSEAETHQLKTQILGFPFRFMF